MEVGENCGEFEGFVLVANAEVRVVTGGEQVGEGVRGAGGKVVD